jgi:lipooligosaccharide transport system permease protein
MTAAVRVLQRDLLVYRHIWRGSLFSSFVTPLLYLSAMGLGLMRLMTPASAAAFDGFDYVHFLGPGLMAAATMQSSVFESTFPIMGKIMWRRNYEAMLATPMAVRDILGGELLYIGFRTMTIATVFLAVLTLFRIPTSPLAVLAIPASVLVGLAFSSAVIAFAATQRNDSGFAAMFRFVINPLFLFSGTFFPIAQLPAPAQWIAAATPLYHGASLIRGVVLQSSDLRNWTIHLAYLVIWSALAVVVAHTLLKRRLVR